MRGSKVRGNNLGEGFGCCGNVQGLLGQYARDTGAMCKGYWGNVQGLRGQCTKVAGVICKGCRANVLTCENKVNSFSFQLKVELGLQVKEEFDKKKKQGLNWAKLSSN